MNGNKVSDASLIAKYKAEASARRIQGGTKKEPNASLVVEAVKGVFTVRFGRDAKPISALGGVAKVLGRSRITIPEFKIFKG